MAPTNTLTGTTGNDILNAPGSVDTLVQGLAGNDTITLIRSGDVADAAEGNDIIRQTANGTLANTVNGGLGNDTISFTGGAALFSGSISAASGNDLISLNAATYNGAFVGGGVGNDTITITGQLISTTVIGGENADAITATAANGMVASYIGGGKGADTITVNSVGNTTSSVAAGEGADLVILGSGINYAAGGAGSDTINLGVTAGGVSFGTVVGGGLSDTITFSGALDSGIIYGDGLGVTSSSTATGGEADGADLIGTGGALNSGVTVYGAGGADTINFGAVSTVGAYLNGGAAADRISVLASFGNLTIEGGAGADTITAAAFNSAGLISGGAGADSILLAAITSGTSIQGGAGLDSITFDANIVASNSYIDGGSEADLIGAATNTGLTVSGGTISGGDGNDTIRIFTTRSAQILGGAGADSIVFGSGMNVVSTLLASASTVNGGDGVDTIALTNLGTAQVTTAANTVSAYNANVVYGSGDVVSLGYGSTVGANWISSVTGTVVVLSSNDLANAGAQLAAFTAGSVAVFADSTQTIIYAAGTLTTGFYAINIAGKDLVNTTGLGTVTFNSTNFGFALGNSSGNGLTITLA